MEKELEEELKEHRKTRKGRSSITTRLKISVIGGAAVSMKEESQRIDMMRAIVDEMRDSAIVRWSALGLKGAEIGLAFGITEARVSQIRLAAIKKFETPDAA